MITRR